MEDIRKQLLDDSGRVIDRLQLLSVFFEDELIFQILIRTQVIHKLFENNQELDINKIGLFHLQFTESIIELLKKIKKNNEKTVISITDEIQVNNDVINKLSNAMRTEENFEYAKGAQTVLVSQALFKLYQNLSDYSKDNPFSKDIILFSQRFSADFFYEVPSVLFFDLIDFDSDKVYRNGYGIIDKKLLGLQCKHEFENRFHCGLKAGTMTAEVYRLQDEEEFFIFYSARNLFLPLPFSKISGIKVSGTLPKKARIVEDLAEKNNELKTKAVAARTDIPAEVRALLTEYLEKISGINFLDLIDDYDIQANILKTMLNTDGM